MPKHDHAAIQQSFVSTSDESAKTRSKTRVWLDDESNIERLLEAISGGQSVRRFCEAEGISYSPVQRALTSDELEPRYRQAQEDVAEHLLGEIERISALVEGEELVDPETGEPQVDKDGNVMRRGLDPKAAAVILDGLKWRITKLNQRRYSDRQVVEQHIVDHAKLQREAVLKLARQPRPALIDGKSGRLLPSPGSTLDEKMAGLTPERRELVEARAREIIEHREHVEARIPKER